MVMSDNDCNMPQKIIIFFIALTLAAMQPARAAPPDPLEFKGIYSFGFPGLTFGHMGVEIDQDANGYAITADIQSSGIVNVFVRHVSHSTAQASAKNIEYESNYQTRKKKRYVNLLWRDGALDEEKLVPPENRKTRPEVPPQLKNNAADPLSFILRMREALADALTAGRKNFSINVFDGRRLTKANFTLQNSPRSINHGGKKLAVITVTVRRELLAGFTASELADHDSNEPTLYVYFSNDKRLIPVRLEANAWFGKLSATLTKECRTGESCLLGLK
jgi:hypothetical protein